MSKLKNTSQLHQSSIVANSLMNRERILTGGNSYEKELSFDILKFINKRLSIQKQVSWLDICCGSGKALIETAENFKSKNFKIIGIDLVGMFDKFSPKLKNLRLIETSFEDFKPQTEFDLITCVHGLHYIGDKLKFIQESISFLKSNGKFLANLDLANFRTNNEKPIGRKIAKEFRKNGLEFNSRKYLLICEDRKEIKFDFKYLGADDKAGANYTKQSVVDSYYEF